MLTRLNLLLSPLFLSLGVVVSTWLRSVIDCKNRRRRVRPSATSSALRGEQLEERLALTSTLFVDFGQSFAAGQLDVTVDSLSRLNGGSNTGPDLTFRRDRTGGHTTGTVDASLTNLQFRATDDPGLASQDNFYNGQVVKFSSQPDQISRIVTDYDGQTRQFTVDTPFTTLPSVGASFEVYEAFLPDAAVSFRSFESAVADQAFDFDGQGTAGDAFDARALEQQIVASISRAFEPFDVDIVQVSASTELDVAATLDDGFDPAGDNDAYLLIVNGEFGGSSVGEAAGLYGLAASADIGRDAYEANGGAGFNQTDEVTVVFAEQMLSDSVIENGVPRLRFATAMDTAIAGTAVHEVAHTLGLVHSASGEFGFGGQGAAVELLGQSDLMREGSTNTDYRLNERVFMRYPMLLGEQPQTNGMVTGSATPSEFLGNGSLASVNDWYNGHVVLFVSGTLAGQSRTVQDYQGADRRFVLADAFPNAPDGGDSFVVTPIANHFLALADNVENVGLRSGAPAYVTGTGANDHITVTALSATSAEISLQPYLTATPRADGSIDFLQPLPTYVYQINTSNGVLIEAGAGRDQIEVDTAIAANVRIRSGEADDHLVIHSGLVADHIAYSTETSTGHQLIQVDTMRITTEQTESIRDRVMALDRTFLMSNAVNVISVQKPTSTTTEIATTNRIHYDDPTQSTLIDGRGGGDRVELIGNDLQSLTYHPTSLGAAAITIGTTPIDIRNLGNLGLLTATRFEQLNVVSRGRNRLVIDGAYGQAAQQAWTVGLSGERDADELTELYYHDIDSVQIDLTDAAGSADNVTVRNVLAAGIDHDLTVQLGGGSDMVAISAATAPFSFPSTTGPAGTGTLLFSGSVGADTLDLSGLNSASSLTLRSDDSAQINDRIEFESIDTIRGSSSAEFINVRGRASDLQLFGLGGPDHFSFGQDGWDALAGQVFVAAGSADDQLSLIDNGDGSVTGSTYRLSDQQIDITTADGSNAVITLDPGLEALTVQGGDLADRFDVEPSNQTSFVVRGGATAVPGVAGNDTLFLNDLAGVGRQLSIDTPGNGRWTFDSGRQPVDFNGIEQFNHVERLAVASGPGEPSQLKVFDAETKELQFELTPFEVDFTGGLSVATGDLTGDSIPDVVVGPISGRNPDVQVFDGFDGTPITSFRAIDASSAAFPPDLRFGQLTGDLNGDGLTDLLTNHEQDWWVGISNGQSFDVVHWGIANLAGDQQLHVLDANGDGTDDVAIHDRISGRWNVAISTGSGFQNLVEWTQWTNQLDWQNVGPADVNADGLMDLVGRAETGTWIAAISNGVEFINQRMTGWTTRLEWQDVRTFDINNDGRDDIVGRTPSGTWWAGVSDGVQFNNRPIGAWSSNIAWRDVIVGDLDANGHDDIVGRTPSGVWWAALSDGQTLTNQRWGRWGSKVEWQDVMAADLDGNGTLDIIGRVPSNQIWAAFSFVDGSINQALVSVGDSSELQLGDFDGDGNADLTGRRDGQRLVALASQQFGLQIWIGAVDQTADGINVAIGDVTGDSINDLIVAASSGSSVVKVFENIDAGNQFALAHEWTAFEPSFVGGVSVATTDLNGDGRAEVIVGSSAGRPAEVRVFDGDALQGAPIAGITQLSNRFPDGVLVAAAKQNFLGDNTPDLFVSSAAENPSDRFVEVFDGTELLQANNLPSNTLSFSPATGTLLGPITVTSKDTDRDGIVDHLFAASSDDLGSHVAQLAVGTNQFVEVITEGLVNVRIG